MKKRILFIDRDGTLIEEPPDEQVDSFDKLKFLPGVFTHLGKLARELNYHLVLVSNQDGLGSDAFPESDFWPVHRLVMGTLRAEGIIFIDELIDRTLPSDNMPTRKPGTGMFAAYLNNPDYDLEHSSVVGDRQSDVELADNLGCKAIRFGSDEFATWKLIAEYLFKVERQVKIERFTGETRIWLNMSLDGKGRSKINSGIGFFDHMLDQICHHASVDIELKVEGDLQVDEHHTVEDTALVLGEGFLIALGHKRGISRYGFELPMDDCRAKVLIDFGGRPWFSWDAEFKRELIGTFPTELFSHFFKSFSDAAKCNLRIEAYGENEHHKIEAIFKSFARTIKMAVSQNGECQLPSTKGIL
ncbi:MAG: bifunctional histidinol-phosphatase/imidazoleglycerol-phosphate dehydratase HisB [Bacteroidetes bacterium]|jgi:imidazoleglycerol-phosphate dehydratase / histidinol-phosphatase|nr:bifunctional histidinol-phosphatase/imidazoleglycerol-phosphate dehydratase HisB [Bacteroidota bacterium]MBT3747734.1 bifunctional histidinol-phosphatase/imidazoleglycerol-phosphate dehydratase HisB [Bacteroidota bacterium]MBT4402230.1 bifunctional histidinol-phosphatase/imidazoleglycerol-phosphate dehydratase HisB [Bacteroidota bacterium]MBT4411342.1 bifunctional histidinol-phosphatase/imidazoleglycerol-phosphate dehydratase HisB [Bacteroidota bacterium]MBT5428139.1 bifunctional histidinol-